VQTLPKLSAKLVTQSIIKPAVISFCDIRLDAGSQFQIIASSEQMEVDDIIQYFDFGFLRRCPSSRFTQIEERNQGSVKTAPI